MCPHSYGFEFLTIAEGRLSFEVFAVMSMLVFWVSTPFTTEDGGNTFLSDIGIYLEVHQTALHTRRLTSTFSLPREPKISHLLI